MTTATMPAPVVVPETLRLNATILDLRTRSATIERRLAAVTKGLPALALRATTEGGAARDEYARLTAERDSLTSEQESITLALTEARTQLERAEAVEAQDARRVKVAEARDLARQFIGSAERIDHAIAELGALVEERISLAHRLDGLKQDVPSIPAGLLLEPYPVHAAITFGAMNLAELADCRRTPGRPLAAWDRDIFARLLGVRP